MAKVGRMNVVVTAGTSGLTRGLRASETAIDRFVGRAGKASSIIGGQMRKGINSGGKALLGFGAAATAGVVATGIAIKAGADRIDDLADSSKRLLGNNGATGALAGLRYAAEEAGVEAGVLDKGMGKLLDTISKAKRGDKGSIEAFRQIGLDADNLARLRPEQRMIAVADALGQVKDAGDKISLSKGIFGKAGESLVPLFNEGGEAIQGAIRDMDMFGHSITALDAEKVGTMNDQLGRMQLAWEGATMQLATHFAPLVSDVSARLLGMIEEAGGVGSAVDKAFGAAVEYTGDALDAIEGLKIGWLKFKQTVTGVGLILTDIGNFAANMNPAKHIAEWFTGDETEKRLAGIAPDKRAEFERLLKESGGFQSEKVDMRAGLLAENEDIQQQIKDAEGSRREKGSLGSRFKAWEKSAQAKGATNAAAKLADASVTRLAAEEDITEEAEKQTKEKKDQLRLEQGGQGKFALMAFNGVGSTAKAEKKDEGKAVAKKEPGVVAAALAESPAMAIAASSERETVPTTIPPALLARSAPASAAQGAPAFGSKEYWDAQFFGGGQQPEKGAWDRVAEKNGLFSGTPNYESKRPADGPAKWQSKVPQAEDFISKRSPMEEAVLAMPGKAAPSDAKLDKLAQILEQIASNTKEPRTARLT